MLYTNQKTFRSSQVTPDLPTTTRDQFTSVTLHSTGVIPTNRNTNVNGSR